MGLEEIIKSIELDTKAKTKAVLDNANSEAAKIQEESAKEIENYTTTANAKAEADAKQLMARELSRANAEAKSVYQKAVNEYINQSIDTIQQNIGEYLNSADYEKLLAKLAAMAMSELGEGCTLMLQKRDIPRFKMQGPKQAKVQESNESFIGGLRGISSDGTMYVDYSIEKIMESLRDSVAVKLLNMIKG